MNPPSLLNARDLWRDAEFFILCLFCATAEAADSAPLRAGMIGLDTPHVPALVRLFNNSKPVGDLAGIKVVAGYPGGTADQSKRQGGAPVSLAAVLAKAKAEANARLTE